MRRKAYAIVLGLGLAAGSVTPVWAGPVFDDLLNYPAIDQRSPDEEIKEQGLGLVAHKKATMTAVTPDRSVGQTFKLGEQARVLWRICVGLCHWPDDWTEGEAMTFTLYDSPARKKKLYARTIPFEEKWTKWDTAFDIAIPTQPGAEYYFEITFAGGGDQQGRVVALEQDVYPRGTAFIDGKPQPGMDLYFVVLTKGPADRVANLNRFLDKFNLELPELADAKAARTAGDLDKACLAILPAFEKNLIDNDLIWKPDAGWQPGELESVITENRLYDDDVKEGRKPFIRMDEHTTWMEVWPGSPDFIRQNDFFRQLAWAWKVTGDERYTRKLNDLMADFIQDHPSPFDGGMRGGKWVAMFWAWRLNDAWSGLGNAMESKGLTDDVKLGWIDFWDRMADFAVKEPSHGNHANAVAEAVMQFAVKHPLYAGSKARFAFGFDKLVSNSKKLFLADGACREPAINYHGYSLANLLSGLDTARKYGVTIPPEINTVVEKALAYTAYALKPDGTIPPYGDTDIEDFRPGIKKWDGWRTGEARDGFTMFGRKDLLYIATAGREGDRPAALAHGFPDIGHYFLRSDWGGSAGEGFEDARYLFFRAGHFGSHGHHDLNMVTLYAYGRPLLIDPGRTKYGTPLMHELTMARSHNVLLVDGAEMQRSGPTCHAFASSPGMDLIDAGYDELYPGVNHRRAAIFVRPDYFVLFDHAETKSPQRVGPNFWLPPPALAIDEARRSVRSTDPQGANVLLQVAYPDKIEIAQRNGTVDFDGQRSDIPVVTFWQKADPVADFATLLMPYPAGRPAPQPQVEVSRDKAGTLLVVSEADRTDYVGYAPQPGRIDRGREVAIFARAGVLRVQADRPVSMGLTEGTRLIYQGKPLLVSRKPLASVSVRYSEVAGIEITASTDEPSLAVATLGHTRGTVNGKPFVCKGERYKPFATGSENATDAAGE